MYNAKLLLNVSKARQKWYCTAVQNQRLLALDNRMEMEYFVNETTWIERLRFYCIKNHRTSFRFRLVNFLIKIVSVLLYIIRASLDNPMTTNCCGLCNVNWTDPSSNPTWHDQYTFSWQPLLFVSRGFPIWGIQVCLAALSFMYTVLMTVLLYKGSVVQLIFTVDMFLECICTLPFLATIAWPAWEPLHCLFVPVFLNVWLASSGLTNIMNDLQRATHRHKSALFNQMCLLFATLISLLLTCICGVQHLERAGQHRMDMFDATWFVVVTFSTVGYGDMSPTIWPSKVVVMITIFVALAVLPTQIEELATLWSDKQKEGSVYSRQRANTEKHVVVCATALRLDTIMEFLNEFYAHPIFQNYVVVLLSPEELTGPLRLFLQVPIWAERVTHIKGSVLYDEDLHRVKLDAAEACFVLTSRQEMNRKEADEKTILRAMACKNYAPLCPLYIQVLQPEAKQYIQFADEIICDEEFKYALLSMNCYIPAISTVITLLAHTSKGEEGARHPILWKRNFGRSAGNEIYSVVAGESKFFGECVGLKFPYAAQVAHARCGATLVAIKRKENIQINPGLGCIIDSDDLLFYICLTNEEDAKIVGTNVQSQSASKINANTSYSVIEEKGGSKNKVNHKPSQKPNGHKNLAEIRNEMKLSQEQQMSFADDDDVHHEQKIIKGFPPYFSMVAHTVSHVPTICHILTEPRKHCCLRLDRPCSHCSETNAGKYAWKNSPIIIGAEIASDSLTNIMIPLRAHFRPQESLHPVVFLLENNPEEIFLESISCFPEVYYLLGHMDDLDSLLKAGAMHAHSVIVLDRETSMYAEEEYMADSRQLVALKKLNKFFPGVKVCLELTHATNQRFMQQEVSKERLNSTVFKKTKEIEEACSLPYLFQQSFAGGLAFSSSMIDTLLYQSLVKEDITTLLRLMLGLQYSYGSGFLDTYTVEEKHGGYTYSQLFKEISHRRGGTLLGVFRKEKQEDIEDDDLTSKYSKRRRSSLSNIKKSIKTKWGRGSKKANLSLRKLQAMHSGMSERESLDEIIKNRMISLGVPLDDKVEADDEKDDELDTFGYVMLNPTPDTLLIKGDVIYLLLPEVSIKSTGIQGLLKSTNTSPVKSDDTEHATTNAKSTKEVSVL